MASGSDLPRHRGSHRRGEADAARTGPGIPAGADLEERLEAVGGPVRALVALVVLALVVVIVLALAADERVLVASAIPEIEVEEGETVLVSGTLAEFSSDPAFGDEDDFEDFEGERAILADSVLPIEAEEGEPEAQEVIVDLGDTSDEDEALLGQQVTVVGAVDERVGPHSFVIEETD